MRSKLYVIAAAVLLAGCNILGEETAPVGTRTIVLYNWFYYPATDTLTALEGDTISVTFAWSTNAVDHTVTWDRPTPIPLNDSERQSIGEFVVSLVPGEYTYHCSTPEGLQASMAGKIVIKPYVMP